MAYLQLRTFLYLQDSLDKQKSPRILETLRNSFGFIRFHIIFVKSWSNIETPIKVCLDSIASRTIHNLFSLQESENENLHSFLRA